MGSKRTEMEQAVRQLKQCYREAREEIDEQRTIIREQNELLQTYKDRYMQAQQLVEEQRRQMDMLDMDNTRCAEQVNLEIHKIKLKFKEKLEELTPLPEKLRQTEARLEEAQRQQALAEHTSETLAGQLASARERVHVLLHTAVKPPEKRDKGPEEKLATYFQQRISQLTDNNYTLKREIERLKANVIRMEEVTMLNEKRLTDKMHECAQLGGDLDRARDEAARALIRAAEKVDTTKTHMQTATSEMEKELKRVQIRADEAERNHQAIQKSLLGQMARLKENDKLAQERIQELLVQVQELRRTRDSDGEEEDPSKKTCLCKTFLED